MWTDDLKDRLRIEEGVRLKPYSDSVGILTIGVGRNLQDNGLRPSEVDFMLSNDIAEVVEECSKWPFWSQIPDNVKLVLADMCFNLGFEGVSKFHMMLNSVELGDYKQAADQMLQSKWAEQVGQRAIKLADVMRGS